VAGFIEHCHKFRGSTGTKADPSGRLHAGIVGSNPAGSMGSVSCECCFFCHIRVSAMGRYHVQKSHAECVLVSLSVISCTSNNNPLPLGRVDRRGQTKKVLASASLQLVCQWKLGWEIILA